jgi:hypothetical protein
MGIARLTAATLAAAAVLLCAAPAWADVEFAPVSLGTTPEARAVTIVNDGAETFETGSAKISGPDAASFPFAYAQGSCDLRSVPADRGCSIGVAFDPQRVGRQSASLELPVAGEPDPIRIALSGDGRASLAVTPSAVNFGTLRVLGSQPMKLVTIKNITGETLTGMGGRLGPDPRGAGFSLLQGSCALTLAPGAQCSYGVIFGLGQASRYSSELIVRGRRQVVLAQVGLTGVRTGAWPTRPPRPTPSLAGELRTHLTAALTHWKRHRRFVIQPFAASLSGVAELVVLGRKPVARGAVPVSAGEYTTLRARSTATGRRLLRSGRALRLRVVLRFKAQADGRVSRASVPLFMPAKR